MRVLLLLLLLLLVFGCAGHTPFAPVPRPDTRRVVGIAIDSAIGRGALEILQAALPNEGSVCFYGTARDTMLNGMVLQLLVPAHVTPARQDSAGLFNVWYADRHAGCLGPELLGIAHSHPYAAAPDACTHSDPDAYLLFAAREALFSIVFCGDGRLEVMYQDGRRVPDRWGAAP